MTIGIIGAGSVGRALAAAWTKAEEEVVFGVRDPADPKHADLPAPAQTVTEAGGAETLLFATPWTAVEDAAAAIGPAAGNIVIDATNPLGMVDGALGLVVGHDTSGGEILQSLLPEARVVKCFNQIGAEFMTGEAALSPRPVMFAASDDDGAKAEASRLAEAAGFEAIDGGPLANARLLEPYAMLWIWQAIKGDLGRNFGFALARRS